MNKPIKVLYFIDRMGRGGIQTLVFDIVSKLDRNEIKVDFLFLDDGKEYDLEKKLIENDYTVYKLNDIWIEKPSDFFKMDKALEHFFKENNNYDIIHFHSTSKNYLVLKKAKKYCIPVRVAHSHSTGFQSKNYLKIIFGTILKNKLIKYSTDFFACSEEAGEWLFGHKIVESPNFDIIKNGIDCELFKFKKDIRKKIRNELKINENTIVIGHVGRFTKVKNHSFLIEVFKEYSNKNNNSVLLLVGDGPLKKDIEEKVHKYHLDKKVIFTGLKENVNDYLQAMDYFVFPSEKEGLGIVLIEAQANGLKCFTSKGTVPKEANVSDTVDYISLKLDAKEWAKQILSSSPNRLDNAKKIKESGYDINESVKKIKEFYFSSLKR